jgi:hypothetical protein
MPAATIDRNPDQGLSIWARLVRDCLQTSSWGGKIHGLQA